jgi:hypothetical protein
MIGVKVNICTDLSFGALMHNVLLPPEIPMPVPNPSIETVVMQKWAPGELNNQHKRAVTVQHKGLRIVLEGHDCGPFIQDLTPLVPVNVYYLIMWPFSSRKIQFSASTVQAEGTPVGCAGPFLPMMSCGEPVSAPTAFAVTSWRNTVEVGMSDGDLAIGLSAAAASMALDLIFNAIGGGRITHQIEAAASRRATEAASHAAARQAADEAARRGVELATRQATRDAVRRDVIGRAAGFNDGPSAARRALGMGVDAAASRARAAQSHAPNEGDTNVTISAGVPFANGSVTLTGSSNADRIGSSAQGTLGNRGVAISPTGDLQRTRSSVVVATPDDDIPAPVRVHPPRGGHRP